MARARCLLALLLPPLLLALRGGAALRSPLAVIKRLKETTRPFSNECPGTPRPVIPIDSSDFALDIRMPGVTPKQSDTYFCMSMRLPVDEEAFVIDFKPRASMDTVHHMLLFGCNMPSSTGSYWFCDEGTCTDKANILYAWARNAPPTRLPKGVGFRVGGESGSKYFVLQVHYGDISAFRDDHKDCSGVSLHLTRVPQPLIAGMYLMMSVDTVIPPGEKVVNSDISCHYKTYPMHVFAYRVHTHHLGKVVSGYRVRNGEWTRIGRQSPQLPQAFYPVEHPVEVSFGDILAARCIFTGEGRTEATHIGRAGSPTVTGPLNGVDEDAGAFPSGGTGSSIHCSHMLERHEQRLIDLLLDMAGRSSNGKIFEVDVEIAKQSMTIKTMLADLGMDDEGDDDPVPLPNVNAAIFKKVIQWSSYLDIKGLLDVTFKTVANMIKRKTPEEICKTFNVKNDVTEEEEVRCYSFVLKMVIISSHTLNYLFSGSLKQRIPDRIGLAFFGPSLTKTENKDKSALLQQPKREEEEVLDQGDFYSLLSKLLGEREDVVHVHKYNPTNKAESESDLVAEIANVVQKKDLGQPDAREGAERERASAILVRDRIHKFHRLESTLRPEESRVLIQQPLPGEGTREPEHTGDFHVEEALDWPGVYLLPGQVSGVALDPSNNLVIFHRGDHVWDGNSFDSMFVYQQRGLGPIEEDTILVIDPNNAAVLRSSGKNLFYLPHGLNIDKDGYYWVTDVALHQVFKLDPNSKGPLLILGRSMQPGSDHRHFCQPTDVAVDPGTGTIYVSDGYCNSRIVQFSPSGEFITQWGEGTSGSHPKPGQFSVPHSLALVPHLGQLCVADRENGRIQCFKTDTKEFVREIKHASFGRNVFAISYVPGLLFAVNGKPYFKDQEPLQGFVMNFSNGEIIDVFKPVRKHFDMPHDIVASEDGTVYIGDAHTNTVWKFTLTEKMEHRSVKKAGIEVQEVKEAEAVVENKMENKPTSSELQKMQEKQKLIQEPGSGVPVVLITTLLIIPVVVLLAIAIFIRWKKARAFGADSEHKLEASSARVLGRFRGKGSGGLNLGNFFASRKGYSRKGFDRLSTEGSDHEKEEDGSESEEEYSAPLPTPAPSAS
ncbi:peptidyl-glycine alpha-amidating monooxygenase [Octodon degus]|uniref:S-phase kinase-associated protein 1 n=1 Tax=Octodon degus TaxID=10160 RepID=A0A6P3EL60_OCTDE|nr:peptidyl-glycine alpha-amidating monooxygenase [Octodon degus]